MKTRLALLGTVFGVSLGASVALAGAPTTGPDFVNAAPKRNIDNSLVASPDAHKRVDPYTIVPFEFDQARLGEDGVAEVDAAAAWLKRHPRHKLVLEGHTDALGVAPYNEDLATRRIAAVRARLLQHGISSDRILMITFGEREAADLENPLFPADRKVVMYATELAAPAVLALVRENREALYATWTERGVLMQMQHGLTTQTQTTVSRR